MKYFLIFTMFVFGGTAVVCAVEPMNDKIFELKTADLSVGFHSSGKGGVASFRTINDAEIAASSEQEHRLFTLTFSRQSQIPGEEMTLSNTDAKVCDIQWTKPSDLSEITLTYSGFEKGIKQAVCNVRTQLDKSAVRWGIAVTMEDGWVLEKVQYPCVTLAAPLGTSAEDDAAVVGSAKGGVYRQPSELKKGTWIGHGQPGNLAAQFGCYYDDRAGFYTAAEDAKGYPKELVILRTDDGVELSWIRTCFATGIDKQDYDIVTAGFRGTDGNPADWRDAADIYKAWALKQTWCSVLFADREDLPAWLKNGPAIVRFSRSWLANPERIEHWLTDYWKKHFPEMPLITAYWGWEKHGEWVTPDYFPVYPSDELFMQLVAKTRKMDCHAFPWPSGYHWTLTYNKKSDGSFEWDDRARFDATARPHAVHQRDGSLYVRVPGWLNGGSTACLCGGDDWTIRWWNEEICVPLAQRGCELVQVDQVVGANWQTCYAEEHGHTKGRGLWMTEAFTRQLTTMREAMRKIEHDAVVCFEEPNEWYNHIVGLQDYRDCESPQEWASVFNYLYHEFLPPFQSNPRSNDRVMIAHCAADGQMPHIVPSRRDLADEVLVNGGFEANTVGENPLHGWEQVRSYQGKAWTGQTFSDSKEKYSGKTSLRLLNTKDDDVVQISQNVLADETGLAAGKKYRLSAWLKTGQMTKNNFVNFAVFAPGLQGTGQGGQLKFPEQGSGWMRVSSDFSVPESAEMLRIMIHIDGKAEAWADDITLEEIADDGSTKPLRYKTASSDARFMQKWVELYHGEGRAWLMNGRILHPPKLSCASIIYRNRATPAVFHNAFKATDGKEAVVLANATRERQNVTLFWRGDPLKFTLEADGILLIK